MKKVALLGLVGVLGTTQSLLASEGPPKVNSSVRAEVKDSIPGALAKQTTGGPIEYPEPGKLNLKIIQFCGDGDVAHYAGSHPAWRHQNGGQVPFVLGYHVVPASGPNIPKMDTANRSNDNYFALGTYRMQVDGTYISKFIPATTNPNSTNPNDMKDMLASAKDAVSRLAGTQGWRMGAVAGDGDKFKLYLTVMACPSVRDDDRADLDPSRVVANLRTAASNLKSRAEQAVNDNSGWGGVKDDMELRFSKESNGSVTVQIGSGSVDLDGSLANLAKRVFDFDRPGTSDLGAYRDAIRNASFRGDLENLVNAVEGSANCHEVGNGVNSKAKFAWEPYPYQLTCGALNNFDAHGLRDRVQAYFNPADTQNATWKSNRRQLVSVLIAGAQMQNLQLALEDKIHDDWKLPKQRCFDASPYINYTYQSLAIKVPGNATNPESFEYEAVHPEPGFAIGQDAPYMAGAPAGDTYTVFNMFPGVDEAAYGLDIERGTIPESTASYLPQTVRVNMHLRGIGCPQNVYCMNDHVKR